jgi:hypothetical protein
MTGAMVEHFADLRRTHYRVILVDYFDGGAAP